MGEYLLKLHLAKSLPKILNSTKFGKSKFDPLMYGLSHLSNKRQISATDRRILIGDLREPQGRGVEPHIH